LVILKHPGGSHIADALSAVFQVQPVPRKVEYVRQVNGLLLRGPAAEVQDMEALIAELDLPREEAKATLSATLDLQFFWIKHSKARDLAETLQRSVLSQGDLLFPIRWKDAGRGKRDDDPGYRMTVDERTNVIILLANADQVAWATKVIKALDVAVEQPQPASANAQPVHRK
jgi:hypothetical protein